MEAQASYQEIFMSKYYSDYLTEIGKIITRNRNVTVQMFWDDSMDAKIAFTDDQIDYINAGNYISASFPTFDLYSNSLFGIACHEFGHQRLTNYELKKDWINKLEKGILETSYPMPADMKQLLDKKDNNIIKLLILYGSFLQNVVEDLFIEKQLSLIYPGSCKKELERNRDRLLIFIRKRLQAGSETEMETICNQFLYYFSSLQKQEIEMQKLKYVKSFLKRKEEMEDAMKEPDGQVRWNLTNLLLIDVWPYIKKERKEADKASEEIDNIKQEVKASLQKNQKVGEKVGVKDNPITLEPMIVPENKLQEWKIKIGEKKQIVQWNENAKQQDFGRYHKKIQLQISYPTISQEYIAQYNEMKKELNEAIQNLVWQIKELRDKRKRKEKNLYIGKKINYNAYQRRDKRIFEKKRIQIPNSIAISILIDNSSSMLCKNRIVAAKKAAILLTEVCCNLKLPIAIYAHNASMDVQIDHLVNFDGQPFEKYKIASLAGSGCNRDGIAIQYVAADLVKRKEQKKLLILISDGRPNHFEYKDQIAKKDIQGIKENLVKKGIFLFNAAIGEDKNVIEEIYQEGYINISDINVLPQQLMKVILKYF